MVNLYYMFIIILKHEQLCCSPHRVLSSEWIQSELIWLIYLPAVCCRALQDARLDLSPAQPRIFNAILRRNQTALTRRVGGSPAEETPINGSVSLVQHFSLMDGRRTSVLKLLRTPSINIFWLQSVYRNLAIMTLWAITVHKRTFSLHCDFTATIYLYASNAPLNTSISDISLD